jgi:hypothetical protein
VLPAAVARRRGSSSWWAAVDAGNEEDMDHLDDRISLLTAFVEVLIDEAVRSLLDCE